MVVVSCFVGPRSWRKPGRGSPATAMKDLGRRALELIALVRFRCLLGVKRFRKGVWGSRCFFWGRFFFGSKKRCLFFFGGGKFWWGVSLWPFFSFWRSRFLRWNTCFFLLFLGGNPGIQGSLFFSYLSYILGLSRCFMEFYQSFTHNLSSLAICHWSRHWWRDFIKVQLGKTCWTRNPVKFMWFTMILGVSALANVSFLTRMQKVQSNSESKHNRQSM